MSDPLTRIFEAFARAETASQAACGALHQHLAQHPDEKGKAMMLDDQVRALSASIKNPELAMKILANIAGDLMMEDMRNDLKKFRNGEAP